MDLRAAEGAETLEISRNSLLFSLFSGNREERPGSVLARRRLGERLVGELLA